MTKTTERELIDTQRLIEVRDAVFGYGSRAVVRVDQLDVQRGKCLGIFGPNGAGKTTLVRGITGLLPPISGSVSHEPNRARASGKEPIAYGQPGSLRIGYLQQHRGME